jgi:hypothetical protein
MFISDEVNTLKRALDRLPFSYNGTVFAIIILASKGCEDSFLCRIFHTLQKQKSRLWHSVSAQLKEASILHDELQDL